MFVLMPMGLNGVQTNLVEPSKHFGIPSYGVYRPLGGLECDFVNIAPTFYQRKNYHIRPRQGYPRKVGTRLDAVYGSRLDLAEQSKSEGATFDF